MIKKKQTLFLLFIQIDRKLIHNQREEKEIKKMNLIINDDNKIKKSDIIF
jgi:hypothetical protein